MEKPRAPIYHGVQDGIAYWQVFDLDKWEGLERRESVEIKSNRRSIILYGLTCAKARRASLLIRRKSELVYRHGRACNAVRLPNTRRIRKEVRRSTIEGK